MATLFPASLDNFRTDHTIYPGGADGLFHTDQTETSHPQTHNDLADAVNQIEALLGTGGNITLPTGKLLRIGTGSAQIQIGNVDATQGFWIRNDGGNIVISSKVGDIFYGNTGRVGLLHRFGAGGAGVTIHNDTGDVTLLSGMLKIASGGTAPLFASNTGDKIVLWSNNVAQNASYVIGIQSARMVFSVPATGAVSIRTSTAVGNVTSSTLGDKITLNESGVITAVGTITASSGAQNAVIGSHPTYLSTYASFYKAGFDYTILCDGINTLINAPSNTGRIYFRHANNDFFVMDHGVTTASRTTLIFADTNPIFQSGGSYLQVPFGIYISGGTAFFQNQSQHRGGVNNDSGDLILSASTGSIRSASGQVLIDQSVGALRVQRHPFGLAHHIESTILDNQTITGGSANAFTYFFNRGFAAKPTVTVTVDQTGGEDTWYIAYTRNFNFNGSVYDRCEIVVRMIGPNVGNRNVGIHAIAEGRSG